MMIRRATTADAPACAAIVARWIIATDWMAGGPSRTELEAMMRDGFPKREVWVAIGPDGAEIQGYLSLKDGEDHIYGLYTGAPGNGVGHALMERVKQGRDRITLRSHVPNTDAHRFYAREGFRVVERDLPGNDGIPEILMEWKR